MPRYKPLTIQEQGGLEAYLDSDKQRSKHKGQGYKEFAAMVFNETPVVKIMDRMGVRSHITIDKWIKLYYEEQKNGEAYK